MNYLLGLLTSLLMTLSFPRYDWPWLMPVALTPLLLASAREPRPLRRFLVGWLAGAAVLAGVTDWIRFVVSVHGGSRCLCLQICRFLIEMADCLLSPSWRILEPGSRTGVRRPGRRIV